MSARNPEQDLLAFKVLVSDLRIQDCGGVGGGGALGGRQGIWTPHDWEYLSSPGMRPAAEAKGSNRKAVRAR